MSTSAVPADLMNGAECIDRCIPDGMKMSVLINIFAKLANMSTNPKDLMDGAVCIDRCIPDGMKMAALIYAATQITTGGGGGVTGTLVNTGITTFGQTWTNTTGSPVWVVAQVDLEALEGEDSWVDIMKNGVSVGHRRTSTGVNTSISADQLQLCAMILPGESLSLQNRLDPEGGNSVEFVLAYKLS